jgi:hypothetical protein
VSHGGDQGRPPSNKLSSDDAELVRGAVRAATRYFGIAIKDLDGGASWVAAAMRKGSPLTVSVAERLFRLVQQPDEKLIGKKPPQGPSFEETQTAIDRHSEDPENCPLEQTPTLAYINLMFTAARTVERYARAFPGSVLFVLPGSARSVAESPAGEMADAQILGQIGPSRRRKLIDFLHFYFKLGETPLRTEEGQKILGTLNSLGIVHNLKTAAEINRALPDEHFNDPMPGLEALWGAEMRRNEVLASPKKRRARRKRKATLRRNVDALF